jgi:hypothetical protein
MTKPPPPPQEGSRWMLNHQRVAFQSSSSSCCCCLSGGSLHRLISPKRPCPRQRWFFFFFFFFFFFHFLSLTVGGAAATTTATIAVDRARNAHGILPVLQPPVEAPRGTHAMPSPVRPPYGTTKLLGGNRRKKVTVTGLLLILYNPPCPREEHGPMMDGWMMAMI